MARWHGWEGVAGRQAVAGSREHTGWGTVIVYGFYAQRLPGGVGGIRDRGERGDHGRGCEAERGCGVRTVAVTVVCGRWDGWLEQPGRWCTGGCGRAA